jgi:hypothetical protein
MTAEAILLINLNDEEMCIFPPNNHLWNYTKTIIHLVLGKNIVTKNLVSVFIHR